MSFGDWLEEVATGPRPDGFEGMVEAMEAEWIERALAATGTQSIRRRRIPAEVVVWLVIGMALFRDRTVTSVLSYLGLVEPPKSGKRERATGAFVSSSAVAQARQRLGWEPLEKLFSTTARHWTTEARDLNEWRGLSLLGVDGTTLRLPDTPENSEVYGRPGSSRGSTSYPQARVVAAMALQSRILWRAVVGMYDQNEQTLADELWPKLPERSLTILDRGFVNYGTFARLAAAGGSRHFLCRAKKNLKFDVVRSLGPGDTIVDVTLSPQQRRADPSLPKSLRLRLLEYQIQGFEPQRLLTSLVDATEYPAQEIVKLYHLRWELEIGFSEVKVHTLERRETIRSKTANGVLQEVWGLLVAYNIVRVMMMRAARSAGVEPSRMSFRNSFLLVRSFMLWAWCDAPGTLPKFYAKLCSELVHLVLPERRPERHYPRAVKIKMSGYACKGTAPNPEGA